MSVEYKGEAYEAVWQVAGRELSVKAAGRGITQPINRTIDPTVLAADVAKMMLGYYDVESRDD